MIARRRQIDLGVTGEAGSKFASAFAIFHHVITDSPEFSEYTVGVYQR